MNVEKIVDLLNELYFLDPELMRQLTVRRVPCNRALADHPTVTVLSPNEADPPYSCGLLGVINGIAGLDGRVIGAVIEADDTNFAGFALLEKSIQPHVPLRHRHGAGSFAREG
jgi:hypothetical protein